MPDDRLLDKGGARMREALPKSQEEKVMNAAVYELLSKLDDKSPLDDEIVDRATAEMHAHQEHVLTGHVTVSVKETHDGDDCGCVDETFTLAVGDTVELTHVCHDGRVDKVIATVTEIK